MAKRRDQWAGYRAYRYGSAAPVSLPRVFTGGKRKSAAARVMDVLRDWRSTPFEHEGSARAGIRASLCLQGHDWQIADNEAAALVDEALRLLGAKRPSWLEGQPQYTIPVENCQNCGGPLDADDMANHRRFCSLECTAAAKQFRADWHKKVEAIARSVAWYTVSREKQPERPCEVCGNLYRPGTLDYMRKTETCSSECARELIASRQPERECAGCGIRFKPSVGHGKFHSILCREAHRSRTRIAATAERNAPRPCDQCGKQFEPKRADARFCGERCNWQYQNEKRKEDRREKLADKRCVECGETFEALKGHAKFCDVKCRNRHNDRKRALAKEASRFVCEEVSFREAAE